MFGNGFMFGLGLFVSFLTIVFVVVILFSLKGKKKDKYDMNKLKESFETLRKEKLAGEEYEKLDELDVILVGINENKLVDNISKYNIKKKPVFNLVDASIKYDFYYQVNEKVTKVK